jgi:probable F420-dependent oxidoreductase
VPRPFRFIAPVPRLTQPVADWRAAVRRIEDLGFDSVAISDHFTRGWLMEPIVGLVAAAMVTRHLRVLSLVLANDYRHPVLTHKAAATLDVLSEGRLELGLGAGWLASEYAAAGFRFDPPARRVARLREAVRIIKGLFGAEPLTFAGAHYQISGLPGLPEPVQRPHPPILIGGGGRRILELAAHEANIVGVHCALGEPDIGLDAVADLAADRVQQKVDWIRAAAQQAGRSFDDLELQFSVYLCQITDSPGAGRSASSSFGQLLARAPALVADSPAVLSGTLSRCIDLLEERRERYGFSYWHLGPDVEAVAPIVARLAGT